MTDEERLERLGDGERTALRRLGEAPPPRRLEARVVEALASEGLLDRGASAPARRRWTIGLAAAAVVAAFALGAVIGRGGGGAERGAGGDPSATGPLFMLLLYEGETFDVAADSAEARRRVREYAAWAGELAAAGRAVDGAELAPDAAGLGPWPGAGGPAGSVTGYFVVEAADLDDAVAVARTSPHLRYGGTIEVRPLVGPQGAEAGGPE